MRMIGERVVRDLASIMGMRNNLASKVIHSTTACSNYVAASEEASAYLISRFFRRPWYCLETVLTENLLPDLKDPQEESSHKAKMNFKFKDHAIKPAHIQTLHQTVSISKGNMLDYLSTPPSASNSSLASEPENAEERTRETCKVAEMRRKTMG